MPEIIKHIFIHTLKDSLGILPVLFLAYLFMEMLERKTEAKTEKVIRKAGK